MVDTSFPVHEVGAEAPEQARARALRRLHALLFLLFAAGTAALLLRGLDFYLLSVKARVDHPDFRVLSPSSNLGHGYGLAGTALILTNLAYLIRRRFPRLSVGSLRAWLDIHVFTGLFGGMLVLFHSAFQARSVMAMMTVAALLLVIVTGLLGRYLYSLSPRPEGERLQAVLAALNAVGPGMGALLAERVARVPRTEAPARPSLLAVLGQLPSWRRELRQRRDAIASTVAEYAEHFGPEVRLLNEPLGDCERLYAGEVRSAAAAAALRSWRGVHRFAALLLVLLVAVHIATAWYYGFVWVFAQ